MPGGALSESAITPIRLLNAPNSRQCVFKVTAAIEHLEETHAGSGQMSFGIAAVPIRLQHCGVPRKWRHQNGPKSEARRAERVRYLGEGMFPSPPAIGGLGALQLATLCVVRREAPVTNRLRTFYRLIDLKLLLVSILLILNFFQ